MDGWEIITTAVATAVQATIVIAAACFARGQVLQARHARLASILISIRNDIDSPESRRNRYIFFNDLPEDLTSSLTPEQTRVADRVVIEYEFIGNLVLNRLIDFERIASLYAPSTERSWRRAKPWVEQQRASRGDERYATHFEMFAKKCIRYNIESGRGPLLPFRNADNSAAYKRPMSHFRHWLPRRDSKVPDVPWQSRL